MDLNVLNVQQIQNLIKYAHEFHLRVKKWSQKLFHKECSPSFREAQVKAYYTCYTLPSITQIKDFVDYMRKKVKLNIIVRNTIWSTNQSGDMYALCDY